MSSEKRVEAPQRLSIPNGAGIAAYLSAMIGMLVLGLAVYASEASTPFAETVHAVGKLWMPGAERIGPYSGHETLMVLAWLGSWLILHGLLRRKQLNGGVWLTVFLVGIGAATLLVWPPVWHVLLGD
ncbi:MAG: hypothetical protein ABIO65_13505 [Nitrospiria bacterium]